jgi:hypothetical protein
MGGGRRHRANGWEDGVPSPPLFQVSAQRTCFLSADREDAVPPKDHQELSTTAAPTPITMAIPILPREFLPPRNGGTRAVASATREGHAPACPVARERDPPRAPAGRTWRLAHSPIRLPVARDEVAKIFRVSKQTVRSWELRGMLPRIKVGGPCGHGPSNDCLKAGLNREGRAPSRPPPGRDTLPTRVRGRAGARPSSAPAGRSDAPTHR